MLELTRVCHCQRERSCRVPAWCRGSVLVLLWSVCSVGTWPSVCTEGTESAFELRFQK